MTPPPRTLLAALALALTACGKSADRPVTPRDAVLAAWKAEKLVPVGLTPTPVAFAKDCLSGALENIDVLLCSFATPADARAAESQALPWVGSARGASEAHGSVLIVLADRRRIDPDGRTIQRLMSLAPK